jgi:hypothetical protein
MNYHGGYRYNDCRSKCDCLPISGKHDPDCWSNTKCNEHGGMCDKHEAEAMAAYERSREEDQDIRDAGRGHLLP